jgi:competence protein ComEA
VGDAIKAAGGVGKEGDTSSVNLARFVEDGEQIYVAEPGASTGSELGGASLSNFESGWSVRQGKLNLNRASETELDGLPGVGPVLAKRIVTYRAERGNFGTVDELKKVTGIGPAKFSELRNFVTV